MPNRPNSRVSHLNYPLARELPILMLCLQQQIGEVPCEHFYPSGYHAINRVVLTRYSATELLLRTKNFFLFSFCLITSAGASRAMLHRTSGDLMPCCDFPPGDMPVVPPCPSWVYRLNTIGHVESVLFIGETNHREDRQYTAE